MADSGLKDILVESGVYGENTAQNILNGKQWNRTVRAHKLVFEALWRILWQNILHWLNANQINVDASITQLAEDLAQGFANAEEEAMHEALQQLCQKSTKLKSCWRNMTENKRTMPLIHFGGSTFVSFPFFCVSQGLYEMQTGGYICNHFQKCRHGLLHLTVFTM